MNRNSMMKVAQNAALLLVTLLLCATPVVTMFLALTRASMAV
jgi:hypothetical protein